MSRKAKKAKRAKRRITRLILNRRYKKFCLRKNCRPTICPSWRLQLSCRLYCCHFTKCLNATVSHRIGTTSHTCSSLRQRYYTAQSRCLCCRSVPFSLCRSSSGWLKSTESTRRMHWRPWLQSSRCRLSFSWSALSSTGKIWFYASAEKAIFPTKRNIAKRQNTSRASNTSTIYRSRHKLSFNVRKR